MAVAKIMKISSDLDWRVKQTWQTIKKENEKNIWKRFLCECFEKFQLTRISKNQFFTSSSILRKILSIFSNDFCFYSFFFKENKK